MEALPEKKLKDAAPDGDASRKLPQEQASQIELEMQNEELWQGKAEMLRRAASSIWSANRDRACALTSKYR